MKSLKSYSLLAVVLILFVAGSADVSATGVLLQ